VSRVLGLRRALKAMELSQIQMARVRLATVVKRRERQGAGVEKPGRWCVGATGLDGSSERRPSD
jgi:hypothetical protein